MTTRTHDKHRIAIGSFLVRAKADAAVIALKHLGFTNDEIGIVAKRTAEWEDVTTVGDPSEMLTTSPMGNQIGGLWTLGLTAIVMRAIGPVVVGGVLCGALVASRTVTAVGGITDALVELGLNEMDANRVFEQVVAGRILVLVRNSHRYEDAIAIMRDYGAKVPSSEE